MPTRNVVLTDHQSQFIERLVAAGRYQNASEVLREGLRLIEDREAENAARLEALREATRIGIADIESGRYTRHDSAAALERHLADLTENVIADEGDTGDAR